MNEYLSIGLEFTVGLLLLLGIYRFMGNKEFSQITPVDMIFVVVLAEMVVSISLSNEYHLVHLIFAMLVWTVLIYIIKTISKKSKTARTISQGEPKTIIKNGKVIDAVMEEEQMSKEELDTLLRNVGVWDIEKVEIGILEISGKINCKRKGGT
ncbi:hypothetical protein GCM10008967_37000 [Bacillus carboniphilus]|uniref:DUF421 domain-containing protein n=1 Tax=Bacillus carboniphilus TaxID=86663 RepID=A0ABN0WP50_9BACI